MPLVLPSFSCCFFSTRAYTLTWKRSEYVGRHLCSLTLSIYCRSANFNFNFFVIKMNFFTLLSHRMFSPSNRILFSTFITNFKFPKHSIDLWFYLILFVFFLVLTISDMVSCCCVKSMMIHDLQPLHNSFMSLKPLDRIEAVNIMHLLYIHFAFDFHTQAHAVCLSLPSPYRVCCAWAMKMYKMYVRVYVTSMYRQCFNNWRQSTFQDLGTQGILWKSKWTSERGSEKEKQRDKDGVVG